MNCLSVSVAHHVGTITLNRPQVRNAFNDELIAGLTQAFETLGAQEDVRVVVLAATGGAFCAGADLNWMRRVAQYSHAQNVEDAKALARMLHTIASCPKPTIAAVQGDVYAGGTGLVAACDMAVAAACAHFCISEVRVGLIPATISPYLIRAMGVRAAQRYWLTAERFPAARARELGLVSEVVDTSGAADALQEAVGALCRQLLTASPEAIGHTKRLIEAVAGQGITEHVVQYTAEQIAHARASASGRDGIQAFLNKTAPPWSIPGAS